MSREGSVIFPWLLLFLIVIGNILNWYRKKKISEQNKRQMEISIDDQNSIIGGLANAYFSAYSVDLKTGKCRAIKVIHFFQKIVGSCHRADLVTKAFLNVCVMREDREKMREFTDQSTLVERLRTNDMTVETFHGMISPWEWCRASWIVAGRDEDGNARIVLFTVEDITQSVNEKRQRENEREEERRQARMELEASRAAAIEANKAKTNFLFNMSHDIRTPMNAIIGYANLMEIYFDEKEKCRDYLDKIKKSSAFLLSLVNDVLEMARIESGNFRLEEKVYKITELINGTVSVYRDLMENKGITFNVNVQVQSEYCYGDQTKLGEIFFNIISNAYKYTKTGGKISLVAKQLPCERDGYVLIETRISDTGVGMSKEYLPKIFEEFSREHTSTENGIEGTGLGMPIVKKFVDLMGGTIEVESELGKGTSVTVTIPHKIARAEEFQKNVTLEIDPERFKGKRVLLVEDNELNSEIAIEILKRAGFLVEHAENGKICLDMLAKSEPSYYDLILMDIQMPKLNGYETTQMIRSLPDREKAEIPVIAVTANAFEEDRNDALACGMNGHIAKPIEITKLMNVLGEILADRAQGEP